VAYIQWISWSGGPGAASSAADSELPYPNTFLMPLFGLSAANYAAFMAHRHMYSVASVSSVSVASVAQYPSSFDALEAQKPASGAFLHHAPPDSDFSPWFTFRFPLCVG
jgi:hypothetical protein